VKCFWYDGSNVGDNMLRYMVPHLFNEEAEHVPMTSVGKLFMTGSVLHAVREGDVLAGVGSFCEMPSDWQIPKKLDCRFVRGPRTAKHLDRNNLLFGDAGLLMPCLYTPKRNDALHDYGVIPHYADAEHLGSLPDNCTVISTGLPITEFVDRIIRCRNVISSSLHGIVIAEAYGVPAIRATIGASWDRIASFDFKHADYYEGTERDLPAALTLIEALDISGVGVDLKNQMKKLLATMRFSQ